MKRLKYPRTKNLPFSKSNSSDDVWLKDCSIFEGEDVVISMKMDGECSSCYPDGYVHARSIDSGHHPSRAWLKNFAAKWAYLLPQGYRVVGENCFAFHSLFYTNLPTYFFVYGIYDDENKCLSWKETEEWCDLLELTTVPIIYRGKWDEETAKVLWPFESNIGIFENATCVRPQHPEGFVVRNVKPFHYDDFNKNCAKFIAPHFGLSIREVHWATAPIIPNRLRTSDVKEIVKEQE